MTVLIVGCGDVGSEAGLRFASKGHRVVGWRRSPEKLPKPIEGMAADLSGKLPTIPANTTTVVYTASADGYREESYREAYVHGLSKVLDALSRDKVQPRRFIFVSSTAVYGDALTGPVDEETWTSPTTFSGRVMLEGEDLLHDRLAKTKTAAVALRLSGIYGPGRMRHIDAVNDGTAVIPSQDRLTNRIHRDDAAGAIVHVATMSQKPATIYLGVDDEPANLGAVLRFLATEMACPEPPVGRITTNRGGNKILLNARLRSTGFSFEYPGYREGYRAVLASTARRHA